MINFFKKNFAKGKKSLRICHPELAAPLVADVKEAYKGGGSQSISGSYHLQEYTDFNINKSNVGVETPTYNNISLNTKEPWHYRYCCSYDAADVNSKLQS